MRSIESMTAPPEDAVPRIGLDGPFDVFLSDPPWHYRKWRPESGHGKATDHYPTLKTALLYGMGDEIRAMTAENAALFQWVTPPMLPEGLRLMAAWGFDYRTIAFTWVKRTKTHKHHVGMGSYTRANAEIVILGIKGRMPVADRGVPQIVETVIEKHSRKPIEVGVRIRRLYPEARRLELFGRPPITTGFEAWGLEVAA